MEADPRRRTMDLANVLEDFLAEDHLSRLPIEEVEARKLAAEVRSLAEELRGAALSR